MEVTPTLIQKKDNGKYLSIHFDDNSKYSILSELLRVESPSADVQGHGGPKIIVRNKGNVLIDQIEPVGNYAIRIIFSDNHSSGIYTWDLLHDFGKNHDKYLQEYYNSL
jgi:DUF971 family protein